jgi:CHAD domain-containing protein
MTKKQEKEYFNKEWKDMKAALQSFLKTGSQDDLHDFRVQVKKLRAFLVMADSVADRSKLEKRFKPVRKIFKKAGDIRNAFINLKLAKTYRIENDDFILQQDRLMQQAADQFRLKGFKYLEKLKDARKEIAAEIKPLDDHLVNNFYTTQLHNIAGSLADIHFDESLHQCRKWIKILMYNLKVNGLSLDITVNPVYLQDMQTAIGNWHDNVMAKALFASNGSSDNLVQARISKKHKSLENKIIKLIQDFYNQATTTVEVPVEQLS